MSSRYRLGIDLGTASVALAAYALDDTGKPLDLVYHTVHLFDEPLESGPAGLFSKAAVRRQARLQRRQLDRRVGRQVRVAHLAKFLNLSPREILASADLPTVRARAARKRIDLPELMRVFLNMSKKRGYAGEFSDNKKSLVADGSRGLDAELNRVAAERELPKITLGEYLLWRQEHGLPIRLKVREDTARSEVVEVPNLYALRRHVVEEFEQIWATQEEHHPILRSSRLDKPLREIFRESIFHQRPLKSGADKVGRCQLEPTLPRAPRAQPAFQRFRIEKTLADLRWGVGRRAEQLTPVQKAVMRRMLDANDEVAFRKIFAQLDKEGCPGPVGKGLNLDRLSRDSLPGNKTNSVFRKLKLLDKWNGLESSEQISVVNFLADLGSPEQLDDPEWPSRFSRQDGIPRKFTDSFIQFINQLRVHEKFDAMAKIGFDGGRASYSVKVLERLTEWLRHPNWPRDWSGEFRLDEEMAIRIIYPSKVRRAATAESELSVPPETGNAVVNKALRQLNWSMKRAIAELNGPPAEIVVEMAREMSLGVKRRNERESDNAKNQRARKAAAVEISSEGLNPTPNRIRRVLLWREQDCRCPYCGQLIGLAQALSGSSTEYEHILPRKLTQVGMKTSEIVLAHHECNQKKGDRTPWAAAQNGDATWQAIEHMAETLRKKRAYRKAKLVLLSDFEDEVLTDESIAAFADRQFHATAWVAKEAISWLEPLCPGKVSPSRGELTALLRRHWKLDSVIPQVRFEEGYPVLDEERKSITHQEFEILRKAIEGHPLGKLRDEHPGFSFDRRPDKRIDNRHHLIDAMILGLVSRGLFMAIAREYKALAEGVAFKDSGTQEERERAIKWRIRRQLPIPPPPLLSLRDCAIRAVREQRITRKPDRYPDAAFFKDTAYSLAKGDNPAKARLVLRESIAQIGGANVKTVTIESVRKGIARIESNEVRRIISDEFEHRVNSGIEPTIGIASPIIHPVFGKPIKKVRCVQDQNSSESAYRVEHQDNRGQKHWKYLVHSGYAWLDLWHDENGGMQFELKPTLEAMRYPGSKPPTGVTRLFKGDIVREKMDDRLYRICYFKASGRVACLPIIEPRSFKQANELADRGSKTGRFVPFAQALKRFEVIQTPNVREQNNSS